jgi:predicted alpha/beta superfamily hydrolase
MIKKAINQQKNMKKFFFYFCILLLYLPVVTAQQKSSVIVIVSCDSLPENSSIYITGNDKQIGNWQPDFAKLSNIKNGKWQKKLSFNTGKKLEFKITRGKWENEALNDDGSLPENYKLTVEKDTTVKIKVKLWADQFERKIEGQITGIVRYHLNIGAAKIKPRNVIVWLPPFYFLEEEKRYPVLYMHDGQNLFNPHTSAFKIDWQMDETADSLIRKNLMEEIIIVGIYNTPDRRSEYSENDTGYAYMHFIVDSLKPFIDKYYRTLPDRKHTAVGGSSMGGLISFILAWEYSNVFSKVICMSPAFKYKRFDYVNNVKSYHGKKRKTKIYIDNGGDKIDSLIQHGVDEMLLALNEKGFYENEDYYWLKDENAQHHESAWANRIWRALLYMFGTDEGKKLLSLF